MDLEKLPTPKNLLNIKSSKSINLWTVDRIRTYAVLNLFFHHDNIILRIMVPQVFLKQIFKNATVKIQNATVMQRKLLIN